MRIPIVAAPGFTGQLPASSSTDPPLAFINNEPFLLELQGALEKPADAGGAPDDMQGVLVGKLDLADPTKPSFQIAHHRLEGKIVTLPAPFVLLRTPIAPAEEPEGEKKDKEIEMVALVRKKIVFAKRPEPIVTLSSEMEPPME